MLTRLNTLVILCAALALTAEAQQSDQTARTWAVVIGISRYQKLSGGQQLQFADRDASLFEEAIQKRGVSPQNVKLLTGPDATSAAIKSAVGTWLARSVSRSDTVLIFFSGHGLFEREFGESYLLGYDSDPKDPYGTALSVAELGQALAHRVHSARVLVIADAVRRDFFDPESDPDSSKSFEHSFDQLTGSRPGVSAIIASGPGEFSREGQRWAGHGVFAKHLSDVLFDGAARNDDLAITTDGLFELLKGRVADDTSGKQHPWRSGSGFTDVEVARIERQNAPAASPRVAPSSRTAQPDRATSSRPAEESRASDIRSQPQQRRDATRPITSSPPTTERRPGAVPIGARPGEKPAERTSAQAPPRVGETKAEAAARPDIVRSSGVSDANPNPSPRRTAAPPGTETVKSTQAAQAPRELARADVAVREIEAPPKPTVNPPSAVVLSRDRSANQPEPVYASIPAPRPEAAPSPLVLQLEAAIASNNLIEPRDVSAWDLYQRMISESGTAADASRLKPVLAEALTAQGRAIVSGDVRGDNISDRVDDFKRAGQMLARARALTPDNVDISSLEKLSAAEALISLQFYDEAERALAPLQTAKLAAVENALGLVYHGKLDTWRAERAFKRASELDSKWAAPHYNLALLYRSQQNPAALGEFEAAASTDPGNVNVLAALGDEYFTRQQWKQAADAFRKAVALRPSDDNLHTKLGHALYSQGLQDEANREYQKAQELRRKPR